MCSDKHTHTYTHSERVWDRCGCEMPWASLLHSYFIIIRLSIRPVQLMMTTGARSQKHTHTCEYTTILLWIWELEEGHKHERHKELHTHEHSRGCSIRPIHELEHKTVSSQATHTHTNLRCSEWSGCWQISAVIDTAAWQTFLFGSTTSQEWSKVCWAKTHKHTHTDKQKALSYKHHLTHLNTSMSHLHTFDKIALLALKGKWTGSLSSDWWSKKWSCCRHKQHSKWLSSLGWSHRHLCVFMAIIQPVWMGHSYEHNRWKKRKKESNKEGK